MSDNFTSIDYSIIWKKFHGTLTEREEKQLESWLAESDQNRVFYEKAIRYLHTGSSSGPIDPEVSKQAWKNFQHLALDKTHQQKSQLWLYIASTAAVVLVCFGLYFIAGSSLSSPSPSENLESLVQPGQDKAVLILEDGSSYDLSNGTNISMQVGGANISSNGNSISYQGDQNTTQKIQINTLMIPRGGQFSLTLSDGTKVWLNSETVLKFPTSFESEFRTVELIGEAYFQVSKNENQPFQVLSEGQVIEVLGTEFNVFSYPSEQQVETTLVEGSVKVFLQNAPSSNQILEPNQQSIWLKDSQKIQSIPVQDLEQYISWKDGWFYFRDKTLGAIMGELSRWYDVSVEFENASLKEVSFTGKIRRYENLEDILNLLEKTNEVEFIKERRTIIVK